MCTNAAYNTAYKYFGTYEHYLEHDLEHTNTIVYSICAQHKCELLTMVLCSSAVNLTMFLHLILLYLCSYALVCVKLSSVYPLMYLLLQSCHHHHQYMCISASNNLRHLKQLIASTSYRCRNQGAKGAMSPRFHNFYLDFCHINQPFVPPPPPSSSRLECFPTFLGHII